MKKVFSVIGILLLVSMVISGAFMFGHALKEGNDLKIHREQVRFQRDSLQLEIYKLKIKQKNESNNSSKQIELYRSK